MKLWDDIDNDDIPDGGEFRDSVLSYNNYYAFGAPQPSRNYNQYTGADGYRYSFNGKENDVETVGTAGGTQDYGFRIYNPSLGKFLSVDPLTMDYPELTPYQFASNTPIQAIDLDGAEKDVVIWKLNNGKKPTKLKQMSYYALMKQNVGFLGHGTIHYFYNAESKKIVGAVYEPESILDMFLRKGEEEYQESRKAAMGGINVDQEGTEDPTDFNVLDYGNLEPEVEKPKTYDIQPRKEEEFNAPIDEIVMDEKGDSATHYYSIDKDNVKTQRISKETAKARHDNKGIPISKEPPKETK